MKKSPVIRMKISTISKLIALSIFLFLSADIMAQDPEPIQRSNNKIVLEGKVYYVHVVKAGQTLYSIARAYNVTDKEIIIENPGSSAALQIGQVLKIPARSVIVENVDTGKNQTEQKYHTIAAGETVYSLSRLYKCSVDDLIMLNPDLDINDIPIGTRIKLPFGETDRQELSFDEEGLIHHKVKKGETLWSISRFYKVSMKEIRNLNPHLGWGNPRADDVLKIPQPNTTVNLFAADQGQVPDTINTADVETDMIFDSIADTEIIEEYTYDELFNEDFERGRAYNIAYLIPFNYQEMEPLDSLLKDVKSASRRQRITEDYQSEKETPKSIPLLEFFEGSLLAVDSLTDSNGRFNLHVYDTRRSMAETRAILSNPEMKDMDLIIGPFWDFNLELVAAFGKENHIPVVTPFFSGDSLLIDNPYLFQMTPSYETECKRNAEFIARSYNKNLVFVHDGDSSKLEKIEMYKKELFKELEKYAALENVLFKEVIITNGNTDPILQSLNPDIDNMVILPAEDEAFASMVAGRLNYELSNFRIELYGSSSWFGFDDIEIKAMHALQLHISHMLWFDYNNELHKAFLKSYRQNYLREPVSRTMNGTFYATVGYDLSLYFLSALQKYGKAFVPFMNTYHENGTLNDFNFERLKPNSGWQNTAMHYYYFNPDLDIDEVELPSRPPIHHYLRPAGDDPVFLQWSSPIEEVKADTTIIRH